MHLSAPSFDNLRQAAEKMNLNRDHTYLVSYPEFIAYFRQLPNIDRHHLIIGAHFVYRWIPTVLTLCEAFDKAVPLINLLGGRLKIELIRLFLLIFLIGLSAASAQDNIKLTVIDKDTKQGIPYAYVHKKAQPIGYSDSLGHFSANISGANLSADSLFFSCVGYAKIGYPIHQVLKQSSISMTAQMSTLQEVVIKAASSRNELAIGPNKRLTSSTDFCNDSSWGMIFANFLTFSDTLSSVTITKIEVFVSRKGNSPMRLRILDKNRFAKSLLPGNDITPTSFLFYLTKKAGILHLR